MSFQGEAFLGYILCGSSFIKDPLCKCHLTLFFLPILSNSEDRIVPGENLSSNCFLGFPGVTCQNIHMVVMYFCVCVCVCLNVTSLITDSYQSSGSICYNSVHQGPLLWSGIYTHTVLNPYDLLGKILVPLLQMRQLRFRDVEKYAEIHLA